MWIYLTGNGNQAIQIFPSFCHANYLNLYNFGFATSQGLPALSESLVQMVKIRLLLRGSNETVEMTGHVVAFSKKLNTILVPQRFIDEMNRRLSPNRSATPSRLIVSVDNPTDDRLITFLDDRGYETEADDAESARTALFLRITTGIVIAVGLLISALAFYVLLLSIFLLLQKNTEKIDTLLLIGYRPSTVARPYHLLTLTVNTLVLVIAILLIVMLRTYYIPLFGSLYPSFSAATLAPSLLTGIALYIFVGILNYAAIRRKVLHIWHMHKM